jgi:DNA-binding LytR/AlgR family response regulator
MMRVLIADDEPLALERLRAGLSVIDGAELVAEASNGREALARIAATRPDVALLDVEMPGAGGLAVAEALAGQPARPEIIFVTAHDRHAVKAFDLEAADYLLKPVRLERLREALERARRRLEARAGELARPATAAESPNYDSEIWIRDRGAVTRLPVEAVDVILADGDYVSINRGPEVHTLRESIAALSARLNPRVILRVHRSAMVNLSRVRSIRRRKPRGLALVMADGRLVPVGASHEAEVLAATRVGRWRGQRLG